MQLIEGYWKVFVLMGIGYLLHFAPDSWQDECCRGVVKLFFIGKGIIVGSTDLFGYPDKEQ